MAIFNWQDVVIMAQSGTDVLDLTKYMTNVTLRPSRTLVSRDLAGRNTAWRAAVESYLEAGLEGYILQNENPKFSDFFDNETKVLFMIRLPSSRMFVFNAFVNTNSIVDNGGIQEMNQPLMVTEGYMTSGHSYNTPTQGSVDFSYPANANLFARVKETQSADMTALLNAGTLTVPKEEGIYLIPVQNNSAESSGDMRLHIQGTNIANDKVEWFVGGFQ